MSNRMLNKWVTQCCITQLNVYRTYDNIERVDRSTHLLIILSRILTLHYPTNPQLCNLKIYVYTKGAIIAMGLLVVTSYAAHL